MDATNTITTNTAPTAMAINTQMKAYREAMAVRGGSVAELRITRAANGLIVTFDGGCSAANETFIAANLKEATDIITAQLASKLLEQS